MQGARGAGLGMDPGGRGGVPCAFARHERGPLRSGQSDLPPVAAERQPPPFHVRRCDARPFICGGVGARGLWSRRRRNVRTRLIAMNQGGRGFESCECAKNQRLTSDKCAHFRAGWANTDRHICNVCLLFRSRLRWVPARRPTRESALPSNGRNSSPFTPVRTSVAPGVSVRRAAGRCPPALTVMRPRHLLCGSRIIWPMPNPM
jgi:hypothetical protein